MNIIQKKHSLLAYDSSKNKTWDSVVEQARNGHFMFLRNYMDYHADCFEDASFLLMRGHKVVAILPAHRQGDGLTSHSGLSFGGWLQTSRCLHNDIAAGFELLGQEMRLRGLKQLVYTPSPYPYHTEPCGDDLYLLEKLGAQCIQVRLSAFIATQHLSKRNSKFRWLLQNGEKLTPGKINETTDIERFWEHLSRFLVERHGSKPVHTVDEMRLLKKRFPRNIRLFVLHNENEWLAGMVLFISRNVLRCQNLFYFNRTGQDALTNRLYESIRLNVDTQRPWLDFGTSMNPDTGELVSQLHLQKELFGARGIPIKTFEWVP